MTNRGIKEEEMLDIADLMNDALQNRDDANVLEAIRGKVRELTRRFPLPSQGTWKTCLATTSDHRE